MLNMSKLEGDIRLIITLEAIFIFSLVWGAGINIKKEKRWKFQKFLEQAIENYIHFRIEKTRIRYSPT